MDFENANNLITETDEKYQELLQLSEKYNNPNLLPEEKAKLAEEIKLLLEILYNNDNPASLPNKFKDIFKKE